MQVTFQSLMQDEYFDPRLLVASDHHNMCKRSQVISGVLSLLLETPSVQTDFSKKS